MTTALLRISLGWLFFWAFIDKLFGLGFATSAENAWLNGVSPTDGYLTHAVSGPFAEFYQSMAGSPVTDILFMAGLFLIGLALLLGIGLRIAGYSGVLLMVLMWSSALPLEHNPMIDEHIIYALVFLWIAQSGKGDVLGFGKWWSKTALVKKWPLLK